MFSLTKHQLSISSIVPKIRIQRFRGMRFPQDNVSLAWLRICAEHFAKPDHFGISNDRLILVLLVKPSQNELRLQTADLLVYSWSLGQPGCTLGHPWISCTAPVIWIIARSSILSVTVIWIYVDVPGAGPSISTVIRWQALALVGHQARVCLSQASTRALSTYPTSTTTVGSLAIANPQTQPGSFLRSLFLIVAPPYGMTLSVEKCY